MFVELFRDDLNEYAYSAELASLVYSLANTKHGFSLSVRGYSEKQVGEDEVFLKSQSLKMSNEWGCYAVRTLADLEANAVSIEGAFLRHKC